MNDLEFIFIGWCKQDTHDKIWCSFSLQNRYYCAWGRRGAKLQFKDHGPISAAYEHDLWKLQNKKQQGGYKEVDSFQLFAIFPDFQTEVENQLVLKLLSGKVK